MECLTSFFRHSIFAGSCITRGISRQTRSPMRSILGVCEQSGYRSLTQKFAFYYHKKAHRKMKFKANKKPDAQHTLAYVSNRAIAV